ncbi:MAG: protein-L-isoaspartate O-methyltransferase family protein [Promethearchaeota archaeon]
MERKKVFYSKIQLLLSLLYNGYLKDIRLFKAFLDVHLEKFVPKEILPSVRIYDDAPVLFYYERERPEKLRTISAPHMITIMLQNLILKENDDLLILGAKSGYIAALAHKLAPKGKIVILEANSRIAKITQQNLEHLGLNEKIKVIVKNPLVGMPEMGPWKKILVTGAIKQEKIYPLLNQLDHEYGVLFAPIGEEFIQTYTQILRLNNNFYGKKHLSVRFTPLITQIELDELKLVTDIDEFDKKNAETSTNDLKKSENRISVQYAKDIIEKLNLEPKSMNQSLEIKPRNIFIAFLENMYNTIEILKDDQELEQWTNFIENSETLMDIFKRYKKGIKINLRKIELSLNQIKSYNLAVKQIEYDKNNKTDEFLEKKIEISQKYIEELAKLQNLIKEEINKIKEI